MPGCSDAMEVATAMLIGPLKPRSKRTGRADHVPVMNAVPESLTNLLLRHLKGRLSE